MDNFFSQRDEDVRRTCAAIEAEFSSRRELTLADVEAATAAYEDGVRVAFRAAAERGISARG